MVVVVIFMTLVVLVMLVVLKTMVEDDANCDAGDSEVNCGDDLGGGGVGDGNSNNETDAEYNNGVDSNIDNNANIGERKTKVGCVKDTTSDDNNSNADGGHNYNGGTETNDEGG